MKNIKEKKFLIKVRKQVIFAEKQDSLNLYRKIKVTTFIDHSKLHDAILTNVKNINLQAEICFICHKSSHTSTECFDRLRINALKDDKFDQFTLNFEFDSDSKKLIISFRIIKEIEIISLCSQIKVLLKENYFEKSFLINVSLISQSNSFNLRSLIDSDFIIYMLIHDKLVNKICQKLEIQFILLAKEKLIRDYDEKLARKTITHKILFNLTIKSHKKLTMSMLIADIEHHEAILSKL